MIILNEETKINSRNSIFDTALETLTNPGTNDDVIPLIEKAKKEIKLLNDNYDISTDLEELKLLITSYNSYKVKDRDQIIIDSKTLSEELKKGFDNSSTNEDFEKNFKPTIEEFNKKNSNNDERTI